jgi:hypothetical protein
MPGRQDDVPAGRPGRGRSAPVPAPSRSVALGTAVALAVVVTLVAVLTSDVAVLRGGIVVAAWAVVFAAHVAVRQAAERRLAVQRGEDLRRAADGGVAPGGRADEAVRAELTRLRQEVAALGGLRDELAALRTELAGSFDAEMLVERVLLRTRGSRPADEPGPAGPGADALSRSGEPPRELTGGWNAVRLDPAPATRAYEPAGRERSWDPLVDPLPDALRVDPGYDAGFDAATAGPPGPVTPQRPRPVPHRRRRADEAGGPPTDPGQAATAEHPAVRVGRPPLPPLPAATPAQPDTAGRSRLSDILGERSGPGTGSRPRHRHRAEDGTDDVLSRRGR